MSSVMSVEDYLRHERAVAAWVSAVLRVKIGTGSAALARSLQSGVSLCCVAREIEPRSIPAIHDNVRVAFKMKENIAFFLGAAEDWGVPAYRLFAINDLWELQNICTVVMCVVEVARQAVARFAFATPLVVDTATPVTLPVGDELDTLRRQLQRVRGPTKQRKIVKIAPGIMRRKLEYLYGQGVDLPAIERKLARFQALYRGFAQRRRYQKLLRHAAYRDNVAREILSTERTYVSSLQVCLSAFRVPLLDEATRNGTKGFVTRDDVDCLFLGVDEIAAKNKRLLDTLEPRINAWHPNAKLADCFEMLSAFLDDYVRFVQHYATKVTRLDAITARDPKQERFKKWMQSKMDNDASVQGLGLHSYLIMPVQRVPRYRMLLQDLCKHTWPDHQDLASLEACAKMVGEMGMTINEKQREAENMQRILNVSERLVGKLPISLVEPGRQHVAEFSCTYLKKPAMAFVFSDLLLFSFKPKKGKVSMTVADHMHIALANVAAVDVTVRLTTERLGKKKEELKIVFESPSDASAFVTNVERAKLALASEAEEKKAKRDETARMLVRQESSLLTVEEQLKAANKLPQNTPAAQSASGRRIGTPQPTRRKSADMSPSAAPPSSSPTLRTTGSDSSQKPAARADLAPGVRPRSASAAAASSRTMASGSRAGASGSPRDASTASTTSTTSTVPASTLSNSGGDMSGASGSGIAITIESSAAGSDAAASGAKKSKATSSGRRLSFFGKKK